MRRLVVLFCLFLLCIQEIYAQQQVSDELRAYNDYLLSLSCYKASGELNMAIGEKFMEGDIAGVRRLSAEREKLLMQSIDSVLAFRADAKKSEAAAQLITRLVFNLGFENTGKVLNRFEPGFDPLCLQEVRQSLERESKVRPGMPAADFKVFDREGKEYTLASFKGKYIFLEFSASWCSWCKKEIPSIRQAYERFKDSVVFITIHLDDNRDKWLKDLETHAVPWYCLTDLKAWKSPVAKAYNIAGVPNCFIIGKDGLIKAKELRREEITQQLEKLLAADKGIQFRTGSFQDALQEAEATGKLIFLDGYTSWCAPCKMMNTTVFTDPEVGHFFNEHFINVKFDMEKGEGRELLKRYGMQVFPTYLLLDAAGNEVHRVVGGHDAGEFIRLIREGMDPENSIAGMQKRYETGDREADFLRRYITTLGGGYRFDKIPAVLDELCRKNGETVNEEDWQLIRRYLSDPSSYTFHFVAKHRELFTAYIAPEELEAWIQKVLYVPVFNTVNSLVFDEKEYDAERFKTLRKDIKIVRPERKSYLLSILDYYDAFRMDKMDKVLSIFKKQFMSLPASDRWGLTMQLNAMLCAKGNKAQCEEGLHIFRQLFNLVDPILKNFENALNKRIGSL